MGQNIGNATAKKDHSSIVEKIKSKNVSKLRMVGFPAVNQSYDTTSPFNLNQMTSGIGGHHQLVSGPASEADYHD